MGDLSDRLSAALDGPDVDSVYECAHCGAGQDRWADDCSRCGGVIMRIVLSGFK